ncbi:MAG: alpha/beta fold hydrolase [Betaproteobacteria bacterium]|nr:alpha/beta fold hydrolase [Betaproteobacteria bacterium]
MSYRKAFVVAPIGESLEGARVVNWLVEPGQEFATGDIVMELETDKSVVEIPADEPGRLLERLVERGGVLPDDARAAWIEVQGEAPDAARETAGPVPREPLRGAVAAPVIAPRGGDPEAATQAAVRIAATPAARQLAKQQGVELATVRGSGPDGRIVLADVRAVARAGTPDPRARAGGGGVPAWQAGMQQLEIPVAQGTLHGLRFVAEAGVSRPTLVLLHGLFGDLDTWAGTIVSARRAGLSVAALDLPAHGLSRAPAHDLQALVESVAQAMPALCEGLVTLAGHSLGAAVAARLASRLGQRLHSLTLFAPLGLGTQLEQSFVDGMLHAATDEALARELGKLTAQGSVPSPAFVTQLRQRIDERREDLACLCRSISRQGVQQIHVLPELQALACPVSIVHGRDDRLIPWQHALHAPPRAALHLVPGVGHLPQVEAMDLGWEVLRRAVGP